MNGAYVLVLLGQQGRQKRTRNTALILIFGIMALKAGRNTSFQPRSTRPAAAAVCYVCGAQSAECRLRVRPHGKESFFPFLEYHEAPNEVTINKDGTVDACRVCYAFLLQQWYAFEKSRTPIVKRLYWLKRLESCGSPGSNRPDPQMQVSPQMREEMYKLNIRDPAFVDDHFDTPDLLAKTDFIEKKREEFDAPIDVPKFSVCYCCSETTSRNSVCVVHTSHWSKSESPYFPCILGHTPPNGARSVDNLGRVLMCEPCANYLLQQWQAFELNNMPLHKRKYRLRSAHEKSFEGSTSSTKIICLTCGVKTNTSNMQLVHSNANLNKGPFFPCLERCFSPKGASLSRDGIAQLCGSCAASLYEQWNAHEVTQTPLKKRIYHINNKPVGYTHKLLKSKKIHPEMDESTVQQEVCYICSKSVRHTSVHSVHTSAPQDEHAMHFPFIKDLDRPSKAMPIDSSGRVQVCDDCHGQLKAKWGKAGRNGFDKSFKPIQQENGNTDQACGSKATSSQYIIAKCFICGLDEDPSELNDLHCYPSNEEEGVPFFPFLSNPKASHNSEITATSGVVRACTFCYVNLVVQWDDYEHSDSLMDHNRWLRPYHMRKFTCFTCSRATDIGCRKLLNIAKFNGISALPKPFGGILIEDRQIAIVCKACDNSLRDQKKVFVDMRVPEPEQNFKLDQAEVKDQLSHSKPSVNEKTKIKEKGESVIVIDSDSDGEKDLAALRSHAHLQMSVPQSVIQSRSSQRPASVGRPISVGLPTSGTRPGSAGRPQSSGGPGLAAKPPPLTVMPASSNKPTRTTATVTPLSQSASTMTVTSGNSSSNNAMSTTRTSSFAAALRKLAKKATDIHDEPACDTSPSVASRNSTPSHSVKTSHIIPTQHMVPTSTPPVVTIAPTQTANHGLDSKREHEHHHHHRRPTSNERHHMRAPSESSHSSSSHAIHSSLWSNKESPGAAPHRWEEKPVAQLPSKPEEVHRGFHPYRHAEELHKVLAPSHMSYDPSSASVLASGYPYHPAFLPPTHMQFPHLRLEDHYDRYSYQALRPHFIPLSTHHGLPMPHPSMHHLLGVRHPMDLSLQSSNLQAASLGSHHLLAIDREKMLLEHREREKLAEEARREEREKERERDERETERIRAAAAHDRHRPRSRDEDRHYHSSKEPPPAHLKESHSNHHNHHRSTHHNSDMNVHMAHQHHRMKEEKWPSKPADYRKEIPDGHSVSPHYRNSIAQESSSKNDHRISEERTMREHLLRQERHMAKRHEREREKSSEHMRKVLRVDIPSPKPPPLISPSKPNHEDILRQKLYDRRTVNHLHQVANQYEYDRLPPNNIEPSALSTSKHAQSNHDSLSRSPHTHVHNSEADRTVKSVEKQSRHQFKSERPSVSDYPYDYRKPIRNNSEFVPQPVNNFTRSWMIPEHNVISKLDLEEKKRQASRQIGIYFTSESESDSEEDVEDKKERYRSKMEKISSKSCFPLDRSKAKMSLFQTVGLVTQRKKEALKSQKRMKRRILLQEDCLPPPKAAKLDEQKEGLPSPLSITMSEFEGQPDYKSKCQFFGGLSLEVVQPERRKAMDKEQSVILAYRAKRKANENQQKENEENAKSEVSQKKREPNTTVATEATQSVQLNKLESDVDRRISNSSPHHASASPVLSNPSPLLQIAPPRDHKNGVDSQYQLHGKTAKEKTAPSIRHKSNNLMRDIKKEPYEAEARATLNYGPDMFRHAPSIASTKPKTLAENFAQEFHQSVLRTTQESLANQKTGQNSVVYHPKAESPKTKRRETVINLSSQQAASSQNADKTVQGQETEWNRSEDPGFKWPGLEVLMEAYRRHVNEHNMEKAVLHEQITKLQAHNSELIKLAGKVQSKQQDAEGEHRRLERDQYRHLQELHQLKRCARELTDPRS